VRVQLAPDNEMPLGGELFKLAAEMRGNRAELLAKGREGAVFAIALGDSDQYLCTHQLTTDTPTLQGPRTR
jgi:hypothetical protein